MALTKISTAMISQSAAAVDLNVDAGTFYVDTTNNRVGVGGKTDPDTPLHVVGTATATLFAGSGASLTSIPNSALVNSSITINSTAVSLGGSITLGTDDLSEGSSNLYYTDARVDARVSGGSLGNITTTGYIRGPSSFTIDPAAHGDDTGTVVIAGNLQVDGTTTTINSTTMTVDDKNITLASGSANAAAASGAGFTVDIGTGTNPAITYDGTNDEWDFNKPLNVTGNISSGAITSVIDSTNGLKITANSGGAGATITAFQGSTNSNIRTLDIDAQTFVVNTGAPQGTTSTQALLIDSSQNATFAGTISSGAITSTGQSFLGNTTAITGTSTDATTNVSYLGFYESDKTTRQGYIGYGSSGNTSLYITNDVSGSNVIFRIQSNTRVTFGVNDAIFDSNINIASGHTLQVGGTTVIDSSRNLTNIGTISSGAITSTGTLKSTNATGLILDTGAAYRDVQFVLTGNTGNGTLEIIPMTVPGSGTSSYTTHFKNLVTTGTTRHDLKVDGNATFAGTISSGNITISSNSGLDVHTDDTGIVLRSGNSSATGTPNQFKIQHNAGSVTISNDRGSLAIQNINSLKVGTTEVIDSSRNLTNIGTISSGAITSTGTLVVPAVTVGNSSIGSNSSHLANITINNNGYIGTAYDSTSLNFTTAGDLVATGKLGIGSPVNTAPIAKLYVKGTGTYNHTPANPLGADFVITSSEMTDNNAHSIMQLVSVRQSLTTGSGSTGYLGFSTMDDSNAAGINDAARIAIVNEAGSSVTSATALSFWTNAGTGGSTGAATEKMRITSAGNVGIGTQSPDTNLHVYKASAGSITASSDAQLVVENSGVAAINLLSGASSHGQILFGDSGDADDGQFGYDQTNREFYFKTAGNSTKRLLIDSSGNIGIGTDSPQAKLSVTSTTINSEDILYLKSGADNVNDYLGIAWEIGVGGNGPHSAIRSFGGPSGSDARLGFLTTSDGGTTLTEGLSVAHNGNVGIGTTGPYFPLHVQGPTGFNGEAKNNILAFDTTSATTGTGGGIAFGGYSNGTGGDIYHFGNIQGIKENSTGGNYASAMLFSTRANGATPLEQMRISSAGHVGIGTDNPSKKLHVAGSALFGGGTSRSTDGVGITFTSNNTYSANSDTQDANRYFAITNDSTTANAYAPLSFRVNPSGGSSNAMVDIKLVANGSAHHLTTSIRNPATSAFVDALSIRQDGNVGIGTNSPTAPLQLNTAGNTADGTYYSTFTINNTGSSTWSRLRFDRSGIAKWGISLGIDDKFKINNLFTSGTAATPDDNALVIDNNSNVGIGTATPGRQLEIFKAGEGGAYRIKVKGDTGHTGIEIENTSSNNTNLLFRNPSYTQELYMDVAGKFHVYNNNAHRFTVDQAGNVGIGTTSPDSSASMGGQSPKLTVVGYTSLDGLRIAGGDTGNTIYKTGGNIGIVSASHAVNVQGNTQVNLQAGSNEMFRAAVNKWSLGGGTYPHGRVRSYHYSASLSIGQTVALLQNAGAHTDINFIYWIEAFHSSRSYRTGMGTFGGYGMFKTSSGNGLDIYGTNVSSGIMRLDIQANTSFATTYHISMMIFGDSGITVHNGTLADGI